MGVGRVYTMTPKMVCPLYTMMFDWSLFLLANKIIYRISSTSCKIKIWLYKNDLLLATRFCIFFEKAFVNRCRIRKDPFNTVKQESFDAIAKGHSHARLNLCFFNAPPNLYQRYTNRTRISIRNNEEECIEVILNILLLNCLN